MVTFLYILHCMGFSVNSRTWGEGGRWWDRQYRVWTTRWVASWLLHMQEIVPVDYWHQAYTGKHLKIQPLAIGRQDFLNGYILYEFNSSPDEDCSNQVSLIRLGNIKLEARFRQLLTWPITFIVYAVIEISNRRQVLVDYYWDWRNEYRPTNGCYG